MRGRPFVVAILVVPLLAGCNLKTVRTSETSRADCPVLVGPVWRIGDRGPPPRRGVFLGYADAQSRQSLWASGGTSQQGQYQVTTSSRTEMKGSDIGPVMDEVGERGRIVHVHRMRACSTWYHAIFLAGSAAYVKLYCTVWQP